MNIRCENCGRAALDSDATCWHCGQPLPGREVAARQKLKARESWTSDAGPTSIALYGGLTLLVVVAAILLMAWLGRQPQLQIRLGTRTPLGWTLLTPADRAFTVSLPDDWSWLDGADPAAATELESLLQRRPRLILATHPLGAETDDMAVLFAAGNPLAGGRDRPFMVVAASTLLNRLTYSEAVNFLAASDYDIQTVRFIDDFDKSHVAILVETPLESGPGPDAENLRCRQQFVLGRSQSLLISLCAPSAAYDAFGRTFDEIMGSFQHLDL